MNTGDDCIFTPFAHRGAKNRDETARPFIRSAPFIKGKVYMLTNVHVKLVYIAVM